jgi:hypothetical protein
MGDDYPTWDQFFIFSPPWFLARGGAVRTEQDVATLDFALRDGESGKVLPLFTDADLAERFVAALGDKGAGLSPFSLKMMDRALHLVEVLAQTGAATHVNIDPGPNLGRNPYVPIGEFLAAVRKSRG